MQRKVLATIGGTVLAMGVFTMNAHADQWDKKTILTVHEPIQVRDRLLDPGTYVFKLLDSSSDRHVVQIFNRDQSHIIDTIMAIPNYRLKPTGKSQFTFWETPQGSAKAMRAWFYPGDNFGQEFPYPKHLATLTPPAPAPVAYKPVPPPEPPAPAPEPSVSQAPAKQEEPAPAPEVAQNKAPEPAPAAEPTPSQPVKKLPKTASVLPLIGLGGLFSLGIYGLLRLKLLS